MRIKATWFIPGLLLTLLLGLLWALPTSAATGVVSALDKKGGDAVSYISQTGSIWLQVADADADVVTKHDGDNAPLVVATALVEDAATGSPAGYPYNEIVDRDGNGRINKSDFKVYDLSSSTGSPGDAGHPLDADLMWQDGVTRPAPITTFSFEGSAASETWQITGGAATTYVEFHRNQADTLGGRALSTKAVTKEIAGLTGQVSATETWFETATNFDFPDSFSLADIKLIDTGEKGVGDNNRYATTVEAYNVRSVSDGDGGFQDVKLTVAVNAVGDGDYDGMLDATPTIAASVVESIVISSPTPAVDGGVLGVHFDSTAGGPNGDGTVPVRVTISELNPKCVGDCTGTTPDSKVNVNNGGEGALDVVLKETGPSTGVFGVMVQATKCEAAIASCAAPTQDPEPKAATLGENDPNPNEERDGSGTGTVMVPLASAGRIKVEYDEIPAPGTRRLTVNVDSSGPKFSVNAPTHKAVDTDDRFSYMVDVTDGQSGLTDDDSDTDSIVMVWAVQGSAGYSAAPAAAGADSNGHYRVMRDDFAETDTAGGFTISERISASDLGKDDGDTYNIHFWVIAQDLAGNVSAIDTAPTKGSGDDSTMYTCVITSTGATPQELVDAKCDPHIVSVDNTAPELERAETGRVPATADGDDDGLHDSTRSSTSIVAVFNEALDCGSVSVGDFTVNGVTPSAVNCEGKNVFLTVAAMDADATPEVKVVGAINDVAGNSVSEDSETAVDEIGATLTVMLTGTGEGARPVIDADGKVEITLSSNELLGSLPTASIYEVTGPTDGDYKVASTTSAGPSALSSVGDNYTRSFSAADLGDGLYTVVVVGTDSVGKETTVGDGADEIDLGSDSVYLFESDTMVNGGMDPDYTPANGASVDNPNIFIRVDFEDEAGEYDGDSFKTVTITKATFTGPGHDGTDAMGMMTSRDWIDYRFRPGDLMVGDYKLAIEFEDTAGNTGKDTLNFSMTARKAYSIDINAGANLISFPATPEDGAVDAVFADAAITQVLTYDNAMGLWMTATRGQDGMFVGDLMMVDGHHAYWVISDAPVDVSAMLPRGGAFSTFPPAIEVYEGWNLVPIANVEQMSDDSMMEADQYFANIDWEVAYGYSEGRYMRITKDTTDDAYGTACTTGDDCSEGKIKASGDEVMVGSGYFVYVNEAGVIIP